MSTLLLILALIGSLESDQLAPDQGRQKVIERLDALEKAVSKLHIDLSRQYPQMTAQPMVGLVVQSDLEMDSSGLHALTVIGVPIDEPGDRAGIRRGDRIMAIGQRRIEHEPAEVAYLLLDNGPGPINLTIRRDGQDLVRTIQRAPMTCVQRAAKKLNVGTWQDNLADFYKEFRMIREQLLKDPVGDDLIQTITGKIRELEEQLLTTRGRVEADINELVSKECTIRSP